MPGVYGAYKPLEELMITKDNKGVETYMEIIKLLNDKKIQMAMEP